MMRRRLKIAAVLVVVVLALTGFSSSSGGKGGKSRGSSGGSGSGGGGGCSNSKKSNGSYAGSNANDDSDYGSDDDYGSSGSSSGSSYGDPTPTATATDGWEARVVSCVRKAKGKRKAVTYASVRVTVDPGPTDSYEVDVRFEDASGSVVDFGDTEVELEGGETATVKVPMDSPKQVSRVRKCVATVS
ncbi:hypothetical protein ACFV9P_21445 [Streptomyces sp. NPDC059892]|uniref:hypothetical protein n=1 Tax=Streptomyces sp. NPDC059892 TaxID=3346989 RepID=UPI003649119F